MASDLENSPIHFENSSFRICSKFIMSKEQVKSSRQQLHERRKRSRLNQNEDFEQELGNV